MQDFSISSLQSYAKVPLEIFKVLKVKSVKINIYNFNYDSCNISEI